MKGTKVVKEGITCFVVEATSTDSLKFVHERKKDLLAGVADEVWYLGVSSSGYAGFESGEYGLLDSEALVDFIKGGEGLLPQRRASSAVECLILNLSDANINDVLTKIAALPERPACIIRLTAPSTTRFPLHVNDILVVPDWSTYLAYKLTDLSEQVRLEPVWCEFIAPPQPLEINMMRAAFDLPPDSGLIVAENLPDNFRDFLDHKTFFVVPEYTQIDHPQVLRRKLTHEVLLRNIVRCSNFLLLDNFRQSVLHEALSWGVIPLVKYSAGVESYVPGVALWSELDEAAKLIKALSSSRHFSAEFKREQAIWLLSHSTQAWINFYAECARFGESDNRREIISCTVNINSAVNTGTREITGSTVATGSINENRAAADPLVGTRPPAAVGPQKTPLRVLMQNRPNANDNPGGDTVVLNALERELRERGVEVVVDHSLDVDRSGFDLIHLFNFPLAALLEEYGRRAHSAGIPFVVTTLNEDIPRFHLQGHSFGDALIEYVERGQVSGSFRWNGEATKAVQSAPRFANDWTAKHASRLLTCGASESRSIRQEYPDAKITEVSFGFTRGFSGDRARARDIVGEEDYILCVGRLEYRKNQLALLKALEDDQQTVVLATGGFSYFPRYQNAVQQFKRKGRTILLGRLSDQQLADVYKGAALHCLPSWYELPGLVSLEAAYHGCELVVTDWGSIRDYVGENATYCEPDDVDSIRQAIEQAKYSAKNGALQQRLSALTWSSSVDSLVRVYQEVVKDSHLKNNPLSDQAVIAAPLNVQSNATRGETDEFTEALQRGEQAAKQGQFATAERDLLRAAEMGGISAVSKARVQRALGAIMLAENRFNDALKYFESAVAHNPGEARAFSGLGMTFSQLGRHQQALSALKKALDIEPYDLVSLFELIKVSQELKSYSLAVEKLNKYVSKNPENGDMLFCLAGALYHDKKFKEASECLAKLLALNPDYAGARDLQQTVERAFSVASDLEPSSNKVAAGSPSAAPADRFDDNDLLLTQIEEYKRKGELKKAYGELKNLTKKALLPDQVVTTQILECELRLLGGEFDSGKALIEDLYRAHPGSVKVLCIKGAVSCVDKEWNAARELFERALRIDANCDTALAGMGGYYIQNGGMELAWDFFSRALDINCENKRSLLGLIQLANPLNRLAQLESRLKAYLELHPASLDFLYSLAGCLYAQEKHSEALEYLQRMQLFDPDNQRAKELVDRCLEESPAITSGAPFSVTAPSY